MAYKTDVELKIQLDAVIIVNGNREITPPLHNSLETNIIDSKINKALTSAQIFVGNGSNIATGVAMSGEASISNAGAVTLLNSAVIGKVLTGYTSGSGTVAATDTILQAIQKLNGNTVANDALVVHLAGVETITGVKTFQADIKIDSDVYFLDTTYKVGIEVGAANDLYFASGFARGYIAPSDHAIVSAGGYYIHCNSIAGYVNIISANAINMTATGVITVASDDIAFNAADRLTFNAPTAISFIGPELRFFTDGFETVGFKLRHTLLTGVREVTFQDKTVTVAGINDETFTGTTTTSAQVINLTAAPTIGTNQAGIYVADIVAGNAAIHAKSEAGDLVKLYKYVDADFGNTINTGDSDTDDAISALIAAGLAHGLIATS